MLKKFREDWRAAGEALAQNEAARTRRAAKKSRAAQSGDDTGTVIANAATVAGNDANSAAGGDGCQS